MTVTEAKIRLLRSLEPDPGSGASSNGSPVETITSLIDPKFVKDHAVGLTIGALAAGFVVGYSPNARKFAAKHAWSVLDELLK